jgi:hypothetical protein
MALAGESPAASAKSTISKRQHDTRLDKYIFPA